MRLIWLDINKAGRQVEGLTVLRFGLGELEVSGRHTDRRYEQWNRSRRLGHIQRAEAAPDNSGCRERPKIRGTGGGSCGSIRPLYFGCSRWKIGGVKLMGRRRGVIGGYRGRMRSWGGVLLACKSAHVETAGCSILPRDLFDIFLSGLHDNVQTAAYAARP